MEKKAFVSTTEKCVGAQAGGTMADRHRTAAECGETVSGLSLLCAGGRRQFRKLPHRGAASALARALRRPVLLLGPQNPSCHASAGSMRSHPPHLEAQRCVCTTRAGSSPIWTRGYCTWQRSQKRLHGGLGHVAVRIFRPRSHPRPPAPAALSRWMGRTNQRGCRWKGVQQPACRGVWGAPGYRRGVRLDLASATPSPGRAGAAMPRRARVCARALFSMTRSRQEVPTCHHFALHFFFFFALHTVANSWASIL